ncbi:MAG: tetratricopeptide repeat protein [Bacteroidota bacterium]
MTEYDKLWNYNDPAATEIKFSEALKTIAPEDNSTRLQLLTQIARTQSLQRRFNEAHQILDEVEKQLEEETGVEHIRYFLERGRTFNSSGDKRNAEICFRSALDISLKQYEDVYSIDAIHMLAIIAAPDAAIHLNERAILLAEESNQERAKNWLGSLYNNLAWSYFDKGEYEKALSVFLRALKWREEKKSAPEIFLAKWCVARTLRALNRIEEAIKIQLALFEESVNTDQKDGYVYEELAELHLLRNDPVSKMYFQLAHTELSQDAWLSKSEPDRVERLKKLSL